MARSQPAHDSYDVIIIGAGISGLSAGIRLAQFFPRVLIVEAHAIPGGLNSYYEKRQGRGGPRELFDSGLHAVTNFRARGRKWGFGLVARNLGIDLDELEMREPAGPSRVTTPGGSLRFSNDVELLRSEVRAHFPGQADAFARFEEEMHAWSTDPAKADASASRYLEERITDPDLRDLILLPVLTYGGYREDDIDLRTFAILCRSLYQEGCWCPTDMKSFLRRLTDRYQEHGGELCYGARVARIVTTPDPAPDPATATAADSADKPRAEGIELARGGVIRARHILSSAGLYETGQLAGLELGQPAQISLFQLTASYDQPLRTLGIAENTHFVLRRSPLRWRFRDPEAIDTVLNFNAQDNYQFDTDRHHFKISCFDHIANWERLERPAYRARKAERSEQLMAWAREYYPGLGDATPTLTDSFTPTTIRRYTRHPYGTVYGGAVKAWDGRTPLANLHIIGNDQGGIGISGALTSGVVVANYNVLISTG